MLAPITDIYLSCSKVNPYISQLSPIFQEAVRGGYLIKRKDGTPWQYAYSVFLCVTSGLTRGKVGSVAAWLGRRRHNQPGGENVV